MAFDHLGFRSYVTGEVWETTLREGVEAVADESRYEMHIFVCNSEMITGLSKFD